MNTQLKAIVLIISETSLLNRESFSRTEPFKRLLSLALLYRDVRKYKRKTYGCDDSFMTNVRCCRDVSNHELSSNRK